MANIPKQNSRRKFLTLGLLSGAGAFAGNASAQSAPGSGQTMKMLTRDGRVVEVDKAFLPPAGQNKQATKKDIMKWIQKPE